MELLQSLSLSQSIIICVLGFYLCAWVIAKIASMILARFEEIEQERAENERLEEALAQYQRTYRAQQRKIKNGK